jgi:hypothetical protein
MNRPLVGWDLATWRITQSESSLAANVVAIAEIGGRVEASALIPRIAKLVEAYPILSMGISDSAPVSLETLPDFDFTKYVFVSGQDAVAIATNLSNLQIGPNECLWRLHLIHRNSKTYLICGIHHAIADGNTAMMLLQTLFDNPQFPSEQSWQPRADNDIYENIKSGAGKIVGRLTRDPVGLANDLNVMVQSLTRLISFSNSPAERETSSNLRASFLKIDKRQMQNIVHGNQISNHDVLVALVVNALQRYFNGIDASKKSIIANIPVAMNLDDAAANKLVVARIDFDTQLQSTSNLMKISRQKLRSWRNEPSLALASQLINASQLVPIDWITKTLKTSDATISTLIGSSAPKRILGYELKGVWPLVPPIGAALNFTSVTVGDYVHIGLAIDSLVLENSQLWSKSFEEAALEVFGAKIFEQIFE